MDTLRRTGAANVGGRQNPVGKTAFGKAVALATTTLLGAGDARYRLDGAEGPTDTVYLGNFRRDALDAVGGFDNEFLRNQDYELNWRLREAGQTIWFDPGLVVDYLPRHTVGALARQYLEYGVWKRVMLAKHPRSWRLRQLAALTPVLGFAFSALLGAMSAAMASAGVSSILATILGTAGHGVSRGLCRASSCRCVDCRRTTAFSCRRPDAVDLGDDPHVVGRWIPDESPAPSVAGLTLGQDWILVREGRLRPRKS